jgi:hypothetical protein
MKTRTRLSVWMAGVAGIMIASGVGRAWAAPYTWNSTSDGNWDDGTAAGWNTGGAYPNAQDDTATFSQDLGANATITLNVADGRVGTLTLTDSGADNNKFGWILSGSNPLAFDVAAGSATINATGSTPPGDRVTTHRIIAPITSSAPLTINLGANGGLGLGGNNASLTGGITVNGNGAQWAFVRFDSAASLGAGGNTITVNSGANAVINFASLSQTDLNRFSNSAGLVSFYADFLDHVNDPYNATAFSPAPNLDLTGYNEYFRLGAAGFAFGSGGATTLSGTFTPPSSSFRFGGGGGRLTVDCVLADGAAARSVEISGTEVVFGSFSLLALTKSNTCTGPTEVRNGVLRLAGSNGTALNTSAFNVRSYAYFQLDGGLKVTGWVNETGPVVGNNNNRVADTTPVNLYGGSLNFFGNQASGTTETIGALNANSGWNVLDARWKSGRIYYRTATIEEGPFENRDEAGTGAAVLTAQSLNLNNGAQLKLRGVNVGVAGSSATRVMFTTTPTLVGGGGGAGSTTISIIPGVWYHSNPDSFSTVASLGVYQWVTYDGSVGLRALDNATEYSALVVGENSNNNAQHTFTGSSPTLNLTSATTVNSLKVENNASGTSTISGQTLTLKSGCLLVESKDDGAAVTLSAPLDFNGNAGQVFWYGTIFANEPNLNSVMSNTGGKGVNLLAGNVRELVGKPGDDRYMKPVYIGGANTYTGPTAINGGHWETSGSSERIPNASDLAVRSSAGLTVGSGLTETVASLSGAGTLALGNTSSRMILGSGAGVIGAVTLEGASAYIAPGDMGVGTLTLSGLSTTDGLRLRSGELRIDLMHAQDYDVLAVGSTKVTISDGGYAGSTLVLKLGNAPSVGDTFKILDVAGATAIVGKFSNGDTVIAPYGGTQYRFDILYNSSLGGGDGNDVVLRCTGTMRLGAVIVIR